MNQPQDPSLPVPASYEAAVSELEKLVSRMESDQLPLEELLAGYQRGQFLLDFCRERLAEVAPDADGRLPVVHLVASGEGSRHVLCADPAGVSGSLPRRSAQRTANVLRRVGARRARGRRHEHHYVDRCSSRDRRRRDPR